MSDNKFCIIPWVHMYFSPDGDVFPCCVSSINKLGNVKEQTIEEIWNSPVIKDMRVKFLNNEEPKNCYKCFSQEKVNFRSPRIQFNSDFGKHEEKARSITYVDGTVDDLNLIYWDFRFSNICNFKCRMCGHGLSSAWYDETIESDPDYKFDRIIHINDNSKSNILSYLDKFIDSVEEVYFAGGEPLIMDEHYYILDKLIELGRTDVKIRYNTNLSKLSYKGKSVLDYWNQFTDVHVHISIDGKGNVAEYIRNGLKWKTFDKNLKEVIKLSHLRLAFSITPQIYNICDLPNLIDYLIELTGSDGHFIMSNILHHPAYYSITVLPLELKTLIAGQLIERIKSLKERNYNIAAEALAGVTKSMFLQKGDTDTYLMFRQITRELDAKRDESFSEVCPFISDWNKRYGE